VTSAERRALERDVAQTLGRLRDDLERGRVDLERLPDALREFAEQIDREIGDPVDLGPGVGGVSGGNDPRW
jgi:hypothetical protein